MPGAQGEHRVAAHVAAGVERREVEVAAVVERLVAWRSRKRKYSGSVPTRSRRSPCLQAVERAAQHVTGVALVGPPLRGHDVADQPGDAVASGRQGSTAKVDGSGRATMSDSSTG
jgi:hypothetical protein